VGTRNLTCVVLGGEFKIAQYGQWDGYPSGQGATILKFLSKFVKETDELDYDALTEFTASVAALTEISDADLTKAWEECGADTGSSWVGLAVSDEFEKKYPEFHRDTAAEILDLGYCGKAKKVELSTEFAKDGLFCKFVYVIDLDVLTLTMYCGSKSPDANFGHFASKDGQPPQVHESGYYPVSVVATYNLNKLPTVDEMSADTDNE